MARILLTAMGRSTEEERSRKARMRADAKQADAERGWQPRPRGVARAGHDWDHWRGEWVPTANAPAHAPLLLDASILAAAAGANDGIAARAASLTSVPVTLAVALTTLALAPSLKLGRPDAAGCLRRPP